MHPLRERTFEKGNSNIWSLVKWQNFLVTRPKPFYNCKNTVLFLKTKVSVRFATLFQLVYSPLWKIKRLTSQLSPLFQWIWNFVFARTFSMVYCSISYRIRKIKTTKYYRSYHCYWCYINHLRQNIKPTAFTLNSKSEPPS